MKEKLKPQIEKENGKPITALGVGNTKDTTRLKYVAQFEVDNGGTAKTLAEINWKKLKAEEEKQRKEAWENKK